MAVQHYQSILTPFISNNIPLGNDIPGLDLPFAPKVIAVNQDTNEATISVSPYSKILLDTNINNNLFIIGLQCPIVIKTGEKIWLEILFDKNNTSVCGILRKGNKWSAQYFTNGNNSNKQTVYPEVVDLIATKDLADRANELTVINQEILDLKAAREDAIDTLVSRGFYTVEDGADRKQAFNDEYTAFKTIFDIFVSNLNSYFSDTSIPFYRKQFRLYVPLAYTTTTITNDIQGQEVNAGAIDNSQGSIKTRGQLIQFKVFAAQTTNLLLVDSAYKNLYPSKITIPYGKPIYFPEEEV